ncbi:MAG TPA: NAD-dependent deacylase [Spirochaetota bacterium]|mgnify:CR=1 FL=1|nr:NAD-dependent deacylase [Spirochaetota bacterium]HQO40872.1 NAD-dependent deacylase [Spirochaetota bacterium]
MDRLEEAAAIIRKSRNMIALTGAGVSVESGIPDFRSAGGLWDKYDPAIYASIQSFNSMPETVWKMIFEMIELTETAKPNSAHYALAELESMNFLKALITQNIDNLHQEAGSKNVIEFHGNASHLQCLRCGKEYEASGFDMSGKKIPLCSCGNILKPSVIFFGEMIPHEALSRSAFYASRADVVIVAGTSAVVYPAAAIPQQARVNGAKIIEFNIEETGLTETGTDIFIHGSAGRTLPRLVELLK